MENLLTAQEMAKWLNINEGTLHSWVKKGIIPAMRIKIRERVTWRFDKDKVIKALEINNKRGST